MPGSHLGAAEAAGGGGEGGENAGGETPGKREKIGQQQLNAIQGVEHFTTRIVFHRLTFSIRKRVACSSIPASVMRAASASSVPLGEETPEEDFAP